MHYEPFFFPLDHLHEWNRLYGRAGFLQYQFAVPESGGREALIKILDLLTASGPGVFLAVLKRFGPTEEEGMLSFPIPGYTLAVDLPVRGSEVFDVLTRADAIVLEAGGRIYLGKDARLGPESLPAMYPALSHWLEAKARIDPYNRIVSDLGARLEIVP